MSRAALSLSCLCWATLVGLAAAQPSLDPGDPGMVSMQNFTGGVSLGGTYFNITNVTGDGVGYRNGFTQFGMLAPYWINEDLVLAGNGRLTIGDSITVGGNLGGFLRYYNPASDRIYGVNGFFDLDESVYNNRFKQAGFGVESLGRFLDFRANGYVPTEKGDNFIAPIGLVSNDLVYFEHRVGFLGLAQFEESLSGGDFEFGVPVSPQATWLRAYAGMYAYQAKQNDPVGFRGRLEGWVSDDLSLGVQVTDDRQFGTNVNAQVNFLFSGWKPTRWFPDFDTRERILSPVQRNWRIATGSYGQVVNVPLYNPRTQQPYFLTWVDNSNVGGGDGTVEDPFPVMPPVAPQADMILVRRGISSPVTPVLGSIQLLDYQRLLGEGREHTFLGYANFGPVNIPVTQFNLPGFENTGLYPFVTSPNSIVSLADNNEVSAFTLFNSGGAGITNTAFGSENFNINYVNLTNNAGGGIDLTQASGQGLIHHVNALNNAAGGIGLDSGATPLNLTMFEITSDSNPAGTQAFGISINADNGAVIADLDVIRTDDNDAGIILTETNSSLTATLTNIRSRRSTVGDGILASGVGGTLNLQLDNVIATGNAGRGVYVTGDNTDIQFAQTNLDARANTNNNVEFALINSSTLFGGLQDINVSDSVAGSGLVLGAASNSQIGSLANPFLLRNVTSDDNAVHGLNVQTATSGDVFLGVVDSNFNDNDLDGFHFDVVTGSVLRAGFDTVNLDDNARSAVLGTVAGNSTLDLVMTDVSGQRSGANGMLVTSTTGSNVFVDLTDANFSDSDSGPGAGLFSGIRIDATDSNVDLNLLRTIASNTAAFPAGTQDVGLQLTFAGATQFAGSVTDSFFDNNIVDGIFVSAAGTSTGRIGLDNVSAQDNGQDGFDGRTTGAGVDATFDIENSFFNGNGLAGAGHGLQFLSTDATLRVNLDNTQGDDNASSGLFMDFANTTAVLTALDSSFSGNGDDGVFGNFAAGSNVQINTFENVTGDGNGQHGLNLTVTGVGSTLNGNINGGSFSDNGVDGVNVQALAGGAGLLCFDGTDANDNTDDGFDFNSTGAGSSLAVLLQTSGNFTQLQATGNGDQAVAFNVGPGASGFLFMDGDNLFSPNGAATPIVYTATGAAQAAFQFSGTSSNNAGHGLQVNMTDVAQAWLDIHDATLNGNTLSGVELNLDNVTFAAAALTASFIQGDFTMQPFQIVDSDISNNNDFGIEFNGIDVRLPFVNNARHIDGNTVDGNDLDNIFVSLDSTAQLTNIAALNISNNSVSGSVNGSGLRVEIAGDDTTIGTLAPLRGLTLNNNLADDNDDYGVLVNVQDDAIVRLIRINNTDTTDPSNWSASGNGLDGVLVQATTPGSAPTINNIQINGPGDASDNGGFGINVLLTDVAGSPTITINGAGTGGAGNRTVNNNGQPGIGNTLINTPFTSVTISNNIVDPNQGGGIITSFENSSGGLINISGNTVLANVGIGIGVTLTDNSDITTINIRDNGVIGNEGNGIDLTATDSDITTFNVDGNVSGLNTGHGLNIDLDNADITTLNITDNLIGSVTAGGGPVFVDDSLPVIRAGFNANSLVREDDTGSEQVAPGFDMNFFGTVFNDFFINQNGNITFNSSLFDFTPFPIETNGIPMIAPFFADVDTRVDGLPVTYGTGVVGGRPAFGVNWVDVNYYEGAHPGQHNSFQLVLIDRSDVGAGDFDFEFNYTDITWETGDASNGVGGLGGDSARVGYTNGVSQSLEFNGSGVPGSFLNSGPAATSLVQNSLNSINPGRYIFAARDGAIGIPAGGANGADGIHVEMLDSTITTANIDGNDVSNNQGNAGINFAVVDNSTIGTMDITDNGIRDNNGDGIRFGNVINASNVGTVGGLTIDDTTISGNTGNGIDFGIDRGVDIHGFVGSDLGPVTISNSTITENTGNGVRMVNPDTNLDLAFTFTDNNISDNGNGPFQGEGVNGVNFEISNGQTLDLAMTGNTIDGNVNSGVRLVMNGDNTNILNATIGDTAENPNTFNGNGDAGMAVVMRDDTRGFLIVENSSFDNNIASTGGTFTGVGLGVLLEDTAQLSTLRLGDTDEQNTSFSGNVDNGIQIVLNDSADLTGGLQVLNVVADENGANGMLVRLRGTSTIGDGVGGAIDLLVEDTDPAGVASFSGNEADGLRIERLDTAGLSEVTIRNILFDDNAQDGISLLNANGIANADPTDYYIENNVVTNNDVNGIRAVAQSAAIVNLNIINGNVITGNTGGDAAGGINLLATADAVMTANIDDNDISGNTGNGIIAAVDFFATLNGTWSENQINSNTGDGIRITGARSSLVGAAPTASLLLDQNTINLSGRDGIHVATSSTGATPTTFNLAITGNTIDQSTRDGINMTAGDLSTITVLNADDNLIRLNGEDGIDLSTTSGANIVFFTLDNNTITGQGANVGSGNGLLAVASNTVGGTGILISSDTTTISDFGNDGVNLQASSSAILTADFTDLRSQRNGRRGVSVVNTGNGLMNVSIDGSVPTGLTGDDATSVIDNNGTNGIYVENNAGALGTNNRINFTLTDTSVRGNGNTSDVVTDDDRNGVWIRVGTSSSGFVNADVQRNVMSGNQNIDFVTQSFTATPNPGVASPYTSTQTPDPLARLGLIFEDNRGEQIDVTRFGAVYNNADQFKSPAALFGSTSRNRNAQRLPVDFLGLNNDTVQAAPAPTTTTFAGANTAASQGLPTFTNLGITVGGNTRDITAFNTGTNVYTVSGALPAAPAAATPFTVFATGISGLGASTFQTSQATIGATNTFTTILSDFNDNVATFNWTLDATPFYP